MNWKEKAMSRHIPEKISEMLERFGREVREDAINEALVHFDYVLDWMRAAKLHPKKITLNDLIKWAEVRRSHILGSLNKK